MADAAQTPENSAQLHGIDRYNKMETITD